MNTRSKTTDYGSIAEAIALIEMGRIGLRDKFARYPAERESAADCLDRAVTMLRAMECRSVDDAQAPKVLRWGWADADGHAALLDARCTRELAGAEVHAMTEVGMDGAPHRLCALVEVDDDGTVRASPDTEQESVDDDLDLIDEDPAPGLRHPHGCDYCGRGFGFDVMRNRDAWAHHHGWPDLARDTAMVFGNTQEVVDFMGRDTEEKSVD